MKAAQLERIKHAWRADTSAWRDGRECPGEDVLFDAAAGRGPVRRRRAIVAHIARCGACAESWRAAVAIHRSSDASQSAPRPAGAGGRSLLPAWGPAMGLAAAAVLALAVGIVSLLPMFDAGVPPPSESGNLRGVSDMPLTLNLADGAELPANDLRLSWSPLDDAVIYHVEVTDPELNLVYATRTQNTEVQIPPERVEHLDAGSELNWYVTAVFDDGREARSATRAVIIAGNG